MRLGRWAVAAALAMAAMQAVAAARIELTFDEAYYALWARWPQAGYLDHPPLVAWMIRAGLDLFGHTEFGVRALFWLCGALLPALIAWIGWRLFGEAEAAGAALIFVGAPLAAGAPLATPDTPLTLFWTLALASLVEVWRGREAAWGAVGLAAGAAGLAKMTAGFLPLGFALALAVTPSLRRQCARPGPWLAGALALVVVSPFLAWNVTHGMATFAKQGGRIGARALAPRYVLEFVGAQLALFNPLTGATALFAAARGRAPGEPVRLLAATIAPAAVYFLIHSLHDRVQGNWPAPLYPALALLAARALCAAEGRWAPPAAAAIGLAATAAVYLHLATGWPRLGPGDPTLRIGGWRELAAETFDLAHARHARFVLADGYAATSLLSFYGAAAPEVAELGEPERWTFRPPVDASGEGLAFGPPALAATLGRRFAQVTPLRTLSRRVEGVELESYTLFWVAGEGR